MGDQSTRTRLKDGRAERSGENATAARGEEAALLRREALLTLVTGLGLAVGLLLNWFTDSPLAATAAFAVSYFAGGLPIAINTVRQLIARQVTIDMLMLVAALAAAAVGEVRDGAILLTLFSLANTLEEYALGRTRRAVESLMELRPEVAQRLGPAGLETVPVDSLVPGDRLLVRPGERFAADGAVLVGDSSVDESMLTGESLPVDKSPGSAVFAGTLNGYAAVEMEVTKAAQESTLARMVALVTEAQSERSSGQQFGDWFGERYTLAVLFGSLVALLVLLLVGQDWNEAFYKTATLLVVASPCAVVISIPAATLSALAAAARNGLLFKGGAALEELSGVTVLALDKTGTLTLGRPQVIDVVPLEGDESRLLRRVAGLERASEHPIARSILGEVERRGVEVPHFADARTIPGQGMVARDGDAIVWAGTRKLAQAHGVVPNDEIERLLAGFEGQGKSCVLVGGERLDGIITISDTIRPQAPGLIRELRRLGVERFVMLTGDHPAAALHVGVQLGLSTEDIHAGLLPEDKLDWMRRLAANGKTAYIGDGVNDAAALASASVGIAMGGAGSDVALETADVVLLSDDLGKVQNAFRLSRATNRIVRQNLTFAVGAMLVLVTIALFGNLPLPLAVVGHEGGTILVVLNGLRLLGAGWKPGGSLFRPTSHLERPAPPEPRFLRVRNRR